MRIAFFESTESDKEHLSKLLTGHETVFFSEPLTMQNADTAAEYDAISVFIYSKIDRATIVKLKNVRCISTRSTGFDHIDLAACTEQDIAVFNVPYYGENTVAEHTFALILALSRNVHKSYARGLKGNFSLDGLLGFDLKDKTLGVIGTGHIGLHVIRIAKGFGMHVFAHDIHHDIFLSEVLHFKYAPIDEVLSRSDIVTFHVPYNEHTRHMINRENIGKFKRGSLLINTSRGGIIENEALIESLDQGILSGVGLDVLEGEELIKEEHCIRKNDCSSERARKISQNENLLSRDNVVFTPHIGFFSEEALRRILDTTANNIEQFSHGKRENQVNSKEA